MGQRRRSERPRSLRNRVTHLRYPVGRALPIGDWLAGDRGSRIEPMRTIGKLFQVIGLVVLPLSMMLQITTGSRAATGAGFTVSTMLLMMLLGVAVFGIGRLMEGYGRP